jgi:TetR/AcrR family transcriptional regulator, lmrAB and yxaGH operons repressor
MSLRDPGPRDRLIATALTMIQERGVHATALSDLLKRSSAARNSIYQHFPGGKTELMVAVTDAAAVAMARRIDRLAADGDPAELVSGIIEHWVADMERTGFRTGCPVAAAALAGPDEPSITDAAAHAFALLRERVAAALRSAGADDDTARVRASFVVSTTEGALLQARADRSAQPLRDAQAELIRYLG